MKILAFDTSTKFLTIACLEDDTVVSRYHEDVGIKHSKVLISMIGNVIEEAGWRLEELDLICVGIGPGSFTGLRIAVATVKGIALTLGVKVLGVPTMDAMVYNISKATGKFAPFMDARKGKVYSCIYDMAEEEPKRLTEYLLVSESELLGKLTEEVTFFGDGIEKYREELEAHPLAKYTQEVDWYPKAKDIGKIGFMRKGEAILAEEIEPMYLHAKECNITQKKKIN